MLDLIKQYNELLLKVEPFPDCPPLSPLDKKSLSSLLLTDTFLELELFQSNEPWAVNPAIRRGIAALQEYHRAAEEILILGSEVTRYVNGFISRLDEVEQVMSVVESGCAIHSHLLHLGAKSVRALKSLQSLDRLTLNSASFKSVMEVSVKGNTDLSKAHQIPDVARAKARAEAWESTVAHALNVTTLPEHLGNSTDGLGAAPGLDDSPRLPLSLQLLSLEEPTESIESIAEKMDLAAELEFDDSLMNDNDNN